MITFHRLQTIGGAALAALCLTVASATATDIFFDDGTNFLKGVGEYGKTETFQFQDTRWDHDVITPNSNTMALLIMVNDAQNGGNGLSAHVEYPFTGSGVAHGALVPGMCAKSVGGLGVFRALGRDLENHLAMSCQVGPMWGVVFCHS